MRADGTGGLGGRAAPLRRMVALAAIILGALLLAVGCGSDDGSTAPVLDDPSATGRELVGRYMSLLETEDVEGLDAFLSEAFIRQGADGRFSTKDEYLADLVQIAPGYTISDVTARQDGDGLVVRWLFTVEETVEGRQLGAAPTPRLSTFVWSDGQWRLIAHANFNPPEQ